MRDTMDLSVQLTTLVRSIPGVTAVYPVSTITAAVGDLTNTLSSTVAAVGGAIGAAAGLARESGTTAGGTPGTRGTAVSTVPGAGGVAGEQGRLDQVRISVDGSGSHVLVHIGVDDSEPATDVCRRVHDAVSSYLAGISSESDVAAAVSSISVKVGRIG